MSESLREQGSEILRERIQSVTSSDKENSGPASSSERSDNRGANKEQVDGAATAVDD